MFSFKLQQRRGSEFPASEVLTDDSLDQDEGEHTRIKQQSMEVSTKPGTKTMKCQQIHYTLCQLWKLKFESHGILTVHLNPGFT